MGISCFSLEGKIALVTGSRRGIGKAIALILADAGADVAVCDLVADSGELEAVAEEIKKRGSRSLAVQTDITQKSDVDNLIRRVVEGLGAIDILVNNAGVDSTFTLLETPEEEWNRIIDTDLKSYYLCSRAVSRGMIERRRGNIINVASAAGIRGFGGMSAYNIAKAGVIMLTKVLARSLGRYNIRVNAIAPSIIMTEMRRDLAENPDAAAREAARIPLGRLGEVEDLTGPALFLASDAADYITGHTIVVDGGQLA
jgi:NAD(P)-dependent dehydrogenase (short-subunit alcohol dehydrogenase family)